MEFLPLLVEKSVESTLKMYGRKSIRLTLDKRSAKSIFTVFERTNTVHQRINRLLAKEHPSRVFRGTPCPEVAGFDCFQHAATAISDHRAPKRQGFDWHNSKILFSWKKQGATVRILFTKFRIRKRATETNRRPSKLPQTCVFLAFSHDVEFPPEEIARHNGQIHPFVIHQLADSEVVIIYFFSHVTILDVFGGGDCGAFSSVVFANS